MTGPERPPVADDRAARRAKRAERWRNRRPSRLGTRAGTAPKPDYVLDDDAGFRALLKRVWREAKAAPDLPAAVDVLLTLDGVVPADVQLRALRERDETALNVLCGVSWRAHRRRDPAPGVALAEAAYLGELGLTVSGRIAVRVPSEGPLETGHDLVDGVMRVPWSAASLHEYRDETARAAARRSETVADCRRWLDDLGPKGRDDCLEWLKEAAQRTAPFVLYQEDRQYTNFRDRNTITGKTLWPGHPDCAFSALQAVPLELWSDGDAVAVVCLSLLVRSAGFARIEEANGTQLTVDHVAHLLERTRRGYNRASGPELAPVPAAEPARVASLDELAGALGARRRELSGHVQLYREIHGALMHKVERIAGPPETPCERRERALCARLRETLPVTGGTLAEQAAELTRSPGWLARPHRGFGTGLESLVHATVTGAGGAAEADFAMSRGMRSLPALIRALRDEDWTEIVGWEIGEYFCCVVPSPGARALFGGSATHLADTAWAISARMQYNSWHFIAGNLPGVPEVRARDHFVPPTIPDLAYNSDLHHRGHVAARVRYSIRSPQPVRVLDRTFDGFVDLRLLRCEGRPFDEQDLLFAHRASGFIAHATGLAAGLVADGAAIEVTAFDPAWHWATIAGATKPDGADGTGGADDADGGDRPDRRNG
ncbi:hypothetical protein [Actinomadura soli]|uniref:hypothetical protein n=1 Tax=Actinomadura soli TaxID=2508997 RepID=UPI00197ACDB9|nr:hypothetical protein [Actinomadura soli]